MSSARKVAPARREARWIARATSSLPTPFSPSTITFASVGPTLATIAFTSRIAADSPISAGAAPDGVPAARRASALSTAATRRALSHGLVMKSQAPRLSASTASGTSA